MLAIENGSREIIGVGLAVPKLATRRTTVIDLMLGFFKTQHKIYKGEI